MSNNLTGHRPQNKYLTELTGADDDYCVVIATVPAGGSVPIHSHADRETFYVISGEIEGLNVDRWQTLRAGDVFDVRDGLKHAWWNVSDTDAVMLFVTTNRMGHFLQEISRPAVDAEPDVQRFVRLCHEHGYWLGTEKDDGRKRRSRGMEEGMYQYHGNHSMPSRRHCLLAWQSGRRRFGISKLEKGLPMSEEINFNRRRFFGTATATIATAQLGMIASAMFEPPAQTPAHANIVHCSR